MHPIAGLLESYPRLSCDAVPGFGKAGERSTSHGFGIEPNICGRSIHEAPPSPDVGTAECFDATHIIHP